MSKDQIIFTFYGVFTGTKYKIYPTEGRYEIIYEELPKEMVEAMVTGHIERLGVAFATFYYTLIYNLGVFAMIDKISKKINGRAR